MHFGSLTDRTVRLQTVLAPGGPIDKTAGLAENLARHNDFA